MRSALRMAQMSERGDLESSSERNYSSSVPSSSRNLSSSAASSRYVDSSGTLHHPPREVHHPQSSPAYPAFTSNMDLNVVTANNTASTEASAIHPHKPPRQSASYISNSPHHHHRSKTDATTRNSTMRGRISRTLDKRASVAWHRTLADALDDPQSELNAFLETDPEKFKGLNTAKSWFYSLILEPKSVRSHRIIMLSESYAIFGALFLNGIWFVWEYGSSSEFDNYILERIFHVCSALGIVCNVFMAMFSGFLWILSICYSESNTHWIFGARHYLVYLFHLLIGILFTTVIAVAIGVYNNLKGHFAEWIPAIACVCACYYEGMYQTTMLLATQIPLEYQHFPMWLRYLLLPFPYFNRDVATELPQNAKDRANHLKERAQMEHTMDLYELNCRKSTEFDLEDEEDDVELQALLQQAAYSIGKGHLNIIPYVVKLRHDLYDTVESLQDEDVATLSHYMPRRLAKAVYKQLLERAEEGI